MSERVTCPSCGGAGGGPFGPAGSAWDSEDFVCPRCKGAGSIALEELVVARPGIAKAGEPAPEKKRRTGTES